MTEKEFDCVKMKDEIQRKILEEDAGLSPSERHNRMMERIESDPLLAEIWHKTRRVQIPGLASKK